MASTRQLATGSVSAGYLLLTTNGGTVWSNVPLFYTPAQAYTATAAGASSTAATALYSMAVPGILFSVQSDRKGQHVYAVGSPGATATYTTTAAYSYVPWPTILYSGNSGVSW